MYHGANTIFLLAQNLNAYMKLKNIYDSEKIWQKLDNYYTLEISLILEIQKKNKF